MLVENIGEIKTYLDANKENEEVKNYLNSLMVQPTLEVFKGKLNDADFKSFMDSERDKHSTKSLETWKANNLEALVTAKVKELHPDADPRDVKLQEFQNKFEALEKEKVKEALTNKALKIATEKKLPLELVDFLIGADETATLSNLTALEKVFATHIEAVVTERLKGGYVPPSGGTPPPGTKNPWSKEHFNLTEQGKMLIENPTLAGQFMAQSK